MKKIALIFILISLWSQNSKSQTIYGFVNNYFCSTDLSNHTTDTLIVFSGDPWINLGFRSAIDRFNGRYFFGGSIPGYSGKFHIIDLVDFSIESHNNYPENMEYDYINNRLVWEKNGSFYSLDLITFEQTKLAIIENGNSNIYGQKRTYIADKNAYFYTDYINGSDGDPYYLFIDANNGEILCETEMEVWNNHHYSASGFVCNIHTGDIIGHRNGRYGIVNPCAGSISKLSTIPDYYSHLNNQMAVYNHNDDTYIIPYVTTDSKYSYKIAIVDVYADKIIKTMNQEWDGRMNLQQIYDRPVPQIVFRDNQLYVPKGSSHRWYLDNEFLGETTINSWKPTKNGTYSVEVDYREYTTPSAEIKITTEMLGVEGQTTIPYHIYPNPTSDFINIDIPNNKNVEIQILDMMGKIILERSTSNLSLVRINLTKIPKGSYLIRINSGTSVFTKLIMRY